MRRVRLYTSGKLAELSVFAGEKEQYQVDYFHRKAYATTGYTELTFFNVAKSTEVTNWTLPNKFSEDTVLEAISFTIGYDFTDQAAASSEDFLKTDGQDMLKLLLNGEVQVKIGTRPYIDTYPLGSCGTIVPIQGSISGQIASAASTSYQLFVALRKAPKVIDPPLAIPIHTDLEFKIVWSAKTVVAVTMVLTAHMHCTGFRTV